MIKDFSNNEYLIGFLKKGNEKAYEFLMDTYYQRLCVYANSLCKDIYTSEDIVQNVFSRVWERRHKLMESRSIKSYLYQSVHNEFINQYRRKSKLLMVEHEYHEALIKVLDEDASAINKLIDLVKEEIQNLPPKCKKIFLLGKQEGLTYLEISEHLGVSFRTVENQMSKALAIIRKRVGDRMENILFLLFSPHKNSSFNKIL